jgi:5'-nucleotidase/UDP-sugar diphosphatase
VNAVQFPERLLVTPHRDGSTRETISGKLAATQHPVSLGKTRSAVRFRLSLAFVAAAMATGPIRAATTPLPPPEAIVVVIGDSHSAYDKVAQLVAHIDRLMEENRHVPLAVLIDGDTFEAGNVVARRSGAVIDFALFAALAKRAPTILNLGNHEPDFFDPTETVAKIQATGVTVISGNARDHRTGQPLAPPSTVLRLGAYEATVVGVMTDQLATFRAAIRPDLDLADPVVWAKKNFPLLFQDTLLPIVLSHAGVKADADMLMLVPAGTLFAGAHDHLRFVRPMAIADVYFHSGSWLECFSVAELRWTGKRLRWSVKQTAIDSSGPGDPELIALVRRTRADHLTPEDNAVVGHLPRAWGVEQAAGFAAAAVAKAAGADVAFIGNTTFGSGLPAGIVTRADFDSCVRFDGPIFTAVVDGARVQRLLGHSRAGPLIRFDLGASGEFSYSGGKPGLIDPNQAYRIATSDWGAKNSARYFGEPAIEWQQHPTAQLKPAVLAELAKLK